MDKTATRERILAFLQNTPGEHTTGDIAKALGKKSSNTSAHLMRLAEGGLIRKIGRGRYTSEMGENAAAGGEKNNFLKVIRTEEDNRATINQMLTIFDQTLFAYSQWLDQSLRTKTDFDKQLQFIANFKAISMMADKLMKRWNISHNGYDTSTKQSALDAVAKEEERQKAAHADADIADQVLVVGHYHPDMQDIIAEMPSRKEKELQDELQNLRAQLAAMQPEESQDD